MKNGILLLSHRDSRNAAYFSSLSVFFPSIRFFVLFRLDINSPVRAPVHGEANGPAQIPELVVGVSPAPIVGECDGIQIDRLSVDVGQFNQFTRLSLTYH